MINNLSSMSQFYQILYLEFRSRKLFNKIIDTAIFYVARRKLKESKTTLFFGVFVIYK